MTEFNVSEIDATKYIMKFDTPMKNETIEQLDVTVSIISDYKARYEWSAVYNDEYTLTWTIDVETVLVGNEELYIKLNNDKKFRTDVGG